jgi:hypothetical protein
MVSNGDCITCARWQSYQQVDAARYERAFLNSLDHEVDGVVECAIREVTLIKMAQPHWASARMVKALHRLAIGDRDVAIRIKASLAEAVFSEGLVFVDEGYRTDGDVYSAIVRTLHRQPNAGVEVPPSTARMSD